MNVNFSNNDLKRSKTMRLTFKHLIRAGDKGNAKRDQLFIAIQEDSEPIQISSKFNPTVIIL